MTVEREKPQTLILSGLDPDQVCEELFVEGLEYDRLSPEKVGIHTSFILHDLPEGAGQWISIHFRENLDKLSEIGSLLGKAREFVNQVEEDLHTLAQKLIEDQRLVKVKIILGLTDLSEKWGRRHGFATRQYTAAKKLIRRHKKSIADNPNPTKKRVNPLTLFSFPRNAFIEEFL